MTIRTYSSPEAFKQAIEQRLRSSTEKGRAFARNRQLLIFDRFLARIVMEFGDAATLKGGLVLELRVGRARTTKDIDLCMTGNSKEILSKLQKAARHNADDFMTFEIVPDKEHPEIQNDGLQYDGFRFRAECRLAGKIYGHPFGVDVVFGDSPFSEPDSVTAKDVLAFAGIAPPRLRIYPVETHIAEKLHAYTMPRTRPNSRVKDLPDIALLATSQVIKGKQLHEAIEQTFSFRKTHPMPQELPSPSSTWEKPYSTMATTDELEWPTLEKVTDAAKTFIDPILSSKGDGVWNPEAWTWEDSTKSAKS
jgi:predicted nucleotidyltransferase component of viral defense system